LHNELLQNSRFAGINPTFSLVAISNADESKNVGFCRDPNVKSAFAPGPSLLWTASLAPDKGARQARRSINPQV
jgi:hypothetical protein